MASAPGLSSGLRIIELVSESETGIGFNQLKAALELSSASLNRYLQVLLERQFVGKNENQQYVPGAKLSAMIKCADGLHDVSGMTGPILDRICRETGCTSLWIDFRNGRMICRDKAVHPEGVVMQQIGEVRTDYLLHPWGFLLLAHANDEKRRFYIEYANLGGLAGRCPDESSVQRFIEEASVNGLSDDNGLILQNIRRIAVPIRADSRLAAAIAIGMPGVSFEERFIERIYGILQAEAVRAERLLSASTL
ncbi:helix-turn-helix domain-containing protein [Paenibacillus apiarius]|uniref:helix-turn-helix domain-containing protein n=1 Tax=Paenibacillus apiarius TaxID=46240 RepID=UPI00197E9CF3|nr:helix-turn-helix domain-containing protein [Paenibacillus apiarius]MBN3522963.1 IclR family transcriptional regulator [Paenibacillus apiarius]